MPGYVVVILLFTGIILFVMLAHNLIRGRPGYDYHDDRKGLPKNLPEKRIPNDKLVEVTGARNEELDRILREFCQMYSDTPGDPIILAVQTGLTRHILLFPYDVSYETLLYLITYIEEHDAKGVATIPSAWCTVNVESDNGLFALNGQKIFVKIVDTEEYDGVRYMVSETGDQYFHFFEESIRRHELEPAEIVTARFEWYPDDLENLEDFPVEMYS